MQKLHEVGWIDMGGSGGRTVSITELLEEKVEKLEKMDREHTRRIEKLEQEIKQLSFGLSVTAMIFIIYVIVNL